MDDHKHRVARIGTTIAVLAAAVGLGYALGDTEIQEAPSTENTTLSSTIAPPAAKRSLQNASKPPRRISASPNPGPRWHKATHDQEETTEDMSPEEARELEMQIMEEERQKIETRYSGLKELHGNQPTDPVWSDQATAAISDSIAAIQLKPGEPHIVEELDCRTSICYAQVRHPGEIERRQFMAQFRANGISSTTMRKTGEGTSEMYLGREGTRLPKYEEFANHEEM